MPVRRRILLAELKPRVPQSPVYATWNALDKGSGLTLSNGNLTVAPTTATSDGGVRGTIAMTSGVWYWETVLDSLTNNLFVLQVGIADNVHPIGNQLGFDSAPNSICGCDLNGNFRVNSVNNGGGSGLGTPVAGDVVRHYYDADLGIYRVALNNGIWRTVISDARLSQRPWYPAAYLTRSKQVTARFGAGALSYYATQGAGARRGVYYLPASVPTTVYIGSETFNTGPAESPASTHYMPRIAGDSDVTIDRLVSCWALGGESRAARGELILINNDRALDSWDGYEWRDAEYTLYSGYEGDARAAFTVWAKGVSDSSKWISGDRTRLAIVLSDPVAQLDRPIQTRIYPPTQNNVALAGKPMPITIGKPLICAGALLATDALDTSSRTYEWSWSPVHVVTVFDRGDPFDPPPTDWEYTQTGRGVRLANVPDGPVVANVIGSDLRNVRLNTWNVWDYPAGFTWTSNVPNGWTKTGAETVNRRIMASGTSALFLGDGTGDVSISRGSMIVDGTDALYYVEINVTAATAGYIALRAGTEVLRRISSVGLHRALVVASAASAPNLAVLAAAGSTNVTVSSVRMTYAPTARNLQEFLWHVGELIAAPSWYTFNMNGVESGAAQYRQAVYLDQASMTLDVIQRAMDGVCGWVTSARNGQLNFGSLQRPTTTPALYLSPVNVVSVQRDLEPCKGLTTRMAGRRTHRVHSDGELADSVDAAAIGRTAVSAATRAQLTAEYQLIREWSPATSGTNGRILTAYSHGESAAAVPTLLQDGVDLQREINRVLSMLGLGTVRRYTIEALIEDDATADAIEPGQTVNLTFPLVGLDAGKNLLVIGVAIGFFAKRVTITALEMTA